MAATGKKANTGKKAKISLKILVHKVRNKVVFAEADYKFVDALFSFMTLPIGTIVRLLGKQSGSQKPLGSLNSLYQSVENLPSSYFSTEECKIMLLNPKNSSEVYCEELELNVDNSMPASYFRCEDVSCAFRNHEVLVSYYGTSRCRFCRKLMNQKIVFKEAYREVDLSEGGVFVREMVSFLVTDDLIVMPNFPGSIIQLLNQLRIRDMSLLEERTVVVGLKDILQLLKGAFCSTSPLTELFLAVSEPIASQPNSYIYQSSTVKENSTRMNVKVVAQKSNGKILFAQASEEFTDFLFNFLTVPLGSLACLLNGVTSCHGVDNLFKSISNLDTSRHIKSQDLKDKLLDPKLARSHRCKNMMFPIGEAGPVSVSRVIEKKKGEYCNCRLVFSDQKVNQEFVKRPTMFIVTDDLVVKPLSSISSLNYLQELRVPFNDLEEKEISIGMEEGLGILKAALNTSSALNNGLKSILKKPKQEK